MIQSRLHRLFHYFSACWHSKPSAIKMWYGEAGAPVGVPYQGVYSRCCKCGKEKEQLVVVGEDGYI